MERRRFLKNLGWGTAGVWFVPQLFESCSKEDFDDLEDDVLEPSATRSQNPSVIVIGAGASGLYAASWLKTRGAQVTILESSDRRGGRVKTLSGFADFGVEVGAEEIHGQNSMWYQWAVSQGAQFVNYSSMDYYRLDGLLKSESQISNDPDVNAAWNFIDNFPNYSGADMTVTSYANISNIANRVRHILNADMGNDWGTDNNHLSIKGIAQEDNAWTAGNTNYTIKNINLAQILDAKCANILSSIQYGKKVVRIEYPAGTQPRVQDQNGVWYSADAIVVTVPLTILKNNTITFSPVLPSWKTTAIQNIGMGPGMKIILKFSQRFWADNLKYLTSDLLATVFWYTSKQRGNDNVLTAFVMGENAAALSAQGSAAVNTVVGELNQMYGNNIATNTLIGSHIEDWGINPHIGGAYSFPIVGGGGLATRKNLYKAVSSKVFFAGEATNYKGHNSTVHGALETGLLAAKAVWSVYGV